MLEGVPRITTHKLRVLAAKKNVLDPLITGNERRNL
jgi:hypothetical protein